ncbi:O-methyltransferase-domain-containing protein [Microdochium trichocladiopsis]|uniref:O-methyltransferase-domain-containing protein n=1 Tax=Microdochium trichocladiopsis TaxID=1682393 RepID=A0A9P9BKD3_9PEZI|nr:O-methyltransferase-domain-containing protein [Microdochium trichocladiopsis]KAH7018391.1 O-methyltransferase-domain-containing protein [Microdochium trichocladiopsis]
MTQTKPDAGSSTRIVALSQRIASNTAKLNEFLEANGLPTPSFDVDGPLDHSIPEDAAEIHAARAAIVDDTQELRRLVLGPKEYLMSYCHDDLIAQQAIARYRLVHSFPVGKEATFADIAKASSIPENNIKQFLRFATVQGIFAEPKPGVITHNAVSRLLAEDEVIHDWIDCNTDDMWKSASRTCEALDKWRGSLEPHESGFSLASNSDKTVYEIFGEHPERGRRFANAMRCFTEGTGFGLHHITDNYPWGDIADGGTVVDVGGSQGFVCHALAKKYPNIKSLVVQDLPNIIAEAESQAAAYPELQGRVSYMPHDFFTEQPVKNADVYFFRWILHNWSDARCVRILRNLIPALKQGAKVIINDNILPQPGVLSRWQENRLRSMDLTMFELQNARERELQDWKDLLALADPRFIFVDAVMPPGSNLSIITVEWQG